MTDLIQELRDGLEGTTADKLQEMLSNYFDAGFAEGKEGRNHDTKDGSAEDLHYEIMRHICRLLDRLEAAEKARDEARAALEDFYIIPKAMTDEEWREVKYNVDRKADPNIPLWRIQECIKWAAFETSVRTARARALAKEQTNG